MTRTKYFIERTGEIIIKLGRVTVVVLSSYQSAPAGRDFGASRPNQNIAVISVTAASAEIEILPESAARATLLVVQARSCRSLQCIPICMISHNNISV